MSRLGLHERGGSFVVEVDDGAFGVVNFNVTTHRGDGRIGIIPIIGIHYEPIENRINDERSPQWKGMTLTISTSLGYLTPENRFLEWLFEPGSDNVSEMGGMVSAIREYGLPFMQSYSKVDRIAGALEKGKFTFNESRRYRLPLAYLLQGKNESAKQAIEEGLAALGERDDAAALQYRDFANAVLEELSNKQE